MRQEIEQKAQPLVSYRRRAELERSGEDHTDGMKDGLTTYVSAQASAGGESPKRRILRRAIFA
jgi:hypothetical protein